MDHKKYLLETLQNAIDGKIDYNQFGDAFYSYYITKVGDDELTKEDHNFFTEVQEKFEYTVIEPPEEDRKYGYVSYNEFIEWLVGQIKNLPK